MSYTPWGINPHCSIKTFVLKEGARIPHLPKINTNFGWFEATMHGVKPEKDDGFSFIGTLYEHVDRPGGTGFYGRKK